MDHRTAMLAAVFGEAPDHIPWVPRMDLWLVANRERLLLPASLAGATEVEVADHFGVACHALGADRTIERAPEDFAFFAFGFDNHPDYPFRIEPRDLPVRIIGTPEDMTTTIETPVGSVTARTSFTAEMRRDGISAPIVIERPVKSLDDLDPVAHVFEHLEVVPTPAAYAAYRDRVGTRGLVVGMGSVTASPMHMLMRDLMGVEEFAYAWADDLPRLREFAARLDPFFDAILEADLACEAEVVLWGHNYDQSITWPPFFESDLVPWLQRAGDRLRAAGKRLLCHTDGENRLLVPHYRSARFDVAQSLCPVPMTSMSLSEVRAVLLPQQVIWGGIPSVALLPESMPEQAFSLLLDALAEEIGDGTRLILSVSDNIPPDMDLDRFARLGARIGELRPTALGRLPGPGPADTPTSEG